MPTNIATDVAHTVAQNHRDTGAEIGRERDRFNDVVDVMDDHCTGAMMKALSEARVTWMEELSNIINDLNFMAEQVDRSASDLQTQDSDNAGGIAGVGVNILSGL
ncbi:hypothetical protein HCA58_22525 [Micromonospora sp. HNM0581]|uniref:hypothetical protein n=1 Tax=Micromonospora sp. HNM0581 TaxID=2716341 RepID=UPI00146DBEF1|nr:hypothetical protein [Micromonospora sp. HNM0581]NLU81069.1 hypothetical protein [Micromonospora sp. HNM0581]